MSYSNTSSKYQSYRVFNPLILLFIIGIGGLYCFFLPDERNVLEHFYKNKLYKKIIEYAEKNNLTNSLDPEIIKYLAESYCLEGEHGVCSKYLAKLDQDDIKSIFEITKAKYFQSIEKKEDNKLLFDFSKRLTLLATPLYMDEAVRQFLGSHGQTFEALALYEKAYKKNLLNEKEISQAVEFAWTKNNTIKIKWLNRKFEIGRDERVKNDLLFLYIKEQRYTDALKLLKPLKKCKDYEDSMSIYRESGDFESFLDICIQAYQQFNDISFLKKAFYLATEQKLQEKRKELLNILAKTQEEFALILAETEKKEEKYRTAMERYYFIWQRWSNEKALQAAYFIAQEHNYRPEKEKLLHVLYRATKKKQYLQDLKELYRENPIKLRALVKKNPDYQEARLLLSVSYLNKKQYRKAEEQLLVLIKQDPDNLDYLHSIARLYLDTEQMNKAFPFCKKLYTHDEKYADIYIYSAKKMGGEIYLDALISKWEKDADEETGFKLALFYYDTQNYPQAIKILKQLLQYDDEGCYHLKLGYAYQKNDQPDKAIAVLKKISLKEIPIDMIISLANMYIQKGLWKQATNMLEQWLRFRESSDKILPVLKHLAYLYKRQGLKNFFLQVNLKIEKILIKKLDVISAYP
ncbi:MAG: hypothetical protein D3919_11450 [Candidatus Electrothrix sp. AW5]|nr:hypothetical protein [Candidatus Electrothrix gigas]